MYDDALQEAVSHSSSESSDEDFTHSLSSLMSSYGGQSGLMTSAEVTSPLSISRTTTY